MSRAFAPVLDGIRHRLTRPLVDDRGVVAIEFAFIAPVMIALLLGTVELSQALTADRRVSQIASSTADLVAREKTVTTSGSAGVEGILDIVSSLMRPYPTANLKITLLSVVSAVDDATKTTVCWRHDYNGGTEAAGVQSLSNYPVPTGILDKGSSVIIANVTYDYQSPLFRTYIQGTLPLTQKFYLKPRQSNEVTLDGSKCLS